MLSLKQTQWLSFKIFSSNYCLFKFQLHNLKKGFINGKHSFYNNCFVNIMRTKTIKKRSLKRKLQIMAAVMNSKSNRPILKAESSEVQPKQGSSSSSSDRVRSTCSKEEAGKTRVKESISPSTDMGNKESNDFNKSKQTSVRNIFKSREKISSNILIPSKHGNVNRRYCNNVWSTSLNESSVTQNILLVHSIVHRSFSDSHLQQQHLNLNKDSTRRGHNNYHMRRSDIEDSTNVTVVAERDRRRAWAWRTWQHTSYGKKFSKQSANRLHCNFTLMSYNVLAQDLLLEHLHLYRRHHPKALLWEERWPNLLSEIKQHNADILCFQEVQASHLETYNNDLKQLGYDGIYKQRTGIRTDGCAIFYKTSSFNLVEYTTVEFNQSNIPVLNRDNIAIIVKFSPKSNPGNEFVVATTHLLYNPKREDVRLAQTQVLLSEVDRISYKKDGLNHSHLPIIITGDFNLTPESAVYELITRGILEYENLQNKTLARVSANSTHGNSTGKSLIPPSLRITDQCQHADLVEQRKEGEVVSKEDELKLIQLQHSERTLNGKCPAKVNRSMFSTGTLSHHLALKSAYEHRYGHAIEATTFQNEWITVDYIFYSGVRDEYGLIKEGKLKLVSRYTVPTRDQLHGATIPNFAFGSDHFSLVVRFHLDP